MVSRALADAASWLQSWSIGQALPLWLGHGFDATAGRFEERLTLQGRPIKDVPIRLIVQSRQIWSCALAIRRKWHDAAPALIEQAFASVQRDYHRPDGREGWVFSVNADGSVADAKRDLYSHAFVLLATASYVGATGKREALRVADETLDFLDRELKAPKAGGYVDALPPADALRRQNPHMHMFEALLALWKVSADRKYLDRATQIFELFRTRFFQPREGAGEGVLIEYFDSDLKPASGASGQIVEPGHHCEWIWLLRNFERETGQSVQPFVDGLYAHAQRYGYDGRGLIVDELYSDGRVKMPSHRVWPVTEAIKANVVEAARGRSGAEQRIVSLVESLRDCYFVGTASGGWMDRLDKDALPATDFMPASTLYHVLCAADELLGYVEAAD